MKKNIYWETFRFGLIDENPIFKMILGICSALAVTNSVINTITMTLAVIFVTSTSSALISLIRDWIPKKVRMAVYVTIIATFVMVVDLLLKAMFPDISKALGPYVGLIITNCIIMGRAEAFASNNKVILSIIDGAGVAIGYGVILIFISMIRELLGFGTLCGYLIIPVEVPRLMIMIMAPGAFFTLGIVVWISRYCMYHRNSGNKSEAGGVK